MKAKDSSKSRRLLLLSSIIIGIFCIIGFYFLAQINEEDGSRDNYGLLEKIPSFSADDISGTRVNFKSLAGKVSFVQFIDGRNDGEVGFFKAVHKEWGNSDLVIVLVMSHIEYFTKNKDIVVTPDIHIVDRDANTGIDLAFRIGSRDNKYFVFDRKGSLRNSGYVFRGYEDGPKIELKKLINREELDLSSLFPKGKKVSDIKWLSMLDGMVKSQKCDRYVFSLFTSLCRGCYGGFLLNLLDRAFLETDERLFVAGILARSSMKRT